MRYKLFGHTGLRVSELALGTLTFGEEAGWGRDLEGSRELLELYADAGGNFIDTANRYNAGTSESYVGKLLKGQRDRFVLATKFSVGAMDGDINSAGNHRKNIFRSLHESLERLQTDYVDLYWLHQWDFTTSEEEILRALDDMIRAGKVNYVGISNAPAWVIARANTIAELRGWTAFAGIQIEYSLIERTADRELLPMAKSLDLAVALWGVVGQGILTGKFHRTADQAKPEDSTRAPVLGHKLTERNLAIARLADEIGRDTGLTPSQVALNWARSKGQQMIPVVGARTAEQLRENLACLDQPLPAEQCRRLDEESAVRRGEPHDFLNQPRILTGRFGGFEELLDNHRRLTHRD